MKLGLAGRDAANCCIRMVVANKRLDRGTYLDRAREKLEGLASSLRLPPDAAERMTASWQRLSGPFAAMSVPPAAPWYCGISDDDSPFEFSLVLDALAPEIRVLWESQGDSGDLRAKLQAGLQTHRRLIVGQPRVTHRFDQIADLFLPEDPQGTFVLWHAARLWPTVGLELKAYFNPQVRGRGHSAELVQQALERLGLAASWPYVEKAVRRGEELDDIRYFALDLRADASARIKVYVYHREPTSDQLAGVAALSPAAEPQRIAAFFERVTAGRVPAAGFCPGTCLSFVAGRGDAPSAVTLHVPVRAYVDHDVEACHRVSALAELRPIGDAGEARLLSPEAAAQHQRVAAAMTQRPLANGVGLSTYVSLRSERGAERVTCYLATELFAVQPPR